jgi:hypothetical protein
MFDDKDNLVGLVFVAVCAVVAGVVVWEIATGNRITYHGPRWFLWVLGGIFAAGILYGVIQSFSGRRQGGGMTQWPNPAAGRRPWWKRIFHRDE